MLRADRPIVGSEQPALGEAEHQVDGWQPEGGVTPGGAEIDRLVAVAGVGQAAIAAPAVGGHGGGPGDVGGEEAFEARSTGIGQPGEPEPAETTALSLAAPGLDRPGDQGLAGGPTAGLAGPGTTDIGLIGLHPVRERLATRPEHGLADLVQPGPGGAVAGKAHLPLELHGGDAALAGGDEVDRQKPAAEPGLGLLEDGAGQKRVLLAAGHAFVDQPLLVTPGVVMAAAGATEAARPACLEKIVPALLVWRVLGKHSCKL